jgi:hypothetical protein
MELNHELPITNEQMVSRLALQSAQVRKRNTILKTLSLVFLLLGGLTILTVTLLGKDKAYKHLGFAETFEDY